MSWSGTHDGIELCPLAASRDSSDTEVKEVVVGEEVDGLAQPLDLARGNDVGDVPAMCQHGHGLAAFSPIDGLLP